MKAVIKKEKGPYNIGVMEIEEPYLEEKEILIRVEAAGICHTDFYLVEWNSAIEEEYHPAFPLVMGHEFSGRILKIGKRVKGFEKGDPVVVNPILYCGRCHFCLDGRQQLCNQRTLLGLQKNGGFAEKISVRSENVYKLPQTMDLEVAAMGEPLCTIIHAFEKVRPNYGDTILISGPGTIGMLGLLMGQFSGCGKIIMSGLDLDQERLQVAERLGAVTINVEKENIKEMVKDVTQGAGVDIALETSGSSEAIGEDLDLLKRGGKLMLIGLSKSFAHFLPITFALGEKEMHGIRAYSLKSWDTCINILSSGKIDLKPLITQRLPLDEAERGFELFQQRKGLKILFKPGT